INPTWQVYFGMKPGRFLVGVGAMRIEDFVSGYKDDNGTSIKGGTSVILPRFDLGYVAPLTENLNFELLLEGFPEDYLRMGLTYEFD
ncbi:hypothetical protein K8I28_05660, partial [bacterium]|nr:hypothetical protein [bacterium]